jgi:pimeloyl-ACP methyl ester carboxylesterase
VLDRLAAQPVLVRATNPTNGTADSVLLTRREFAAQLGRLLASRSTARGVPYVIHDALRGSYERFVLLAANALRGSDVAVARGLYMSVVCAEAIPFITASDDAANDRTIVGSTFVDEMRLTCPVWPRARVDTSYLAPVHASVPALLISGQLDPTTPAAQAAGVARFLPNSRHVVVQNSEHTSLPPVCSGGIMKQFIDAADANVVDISCTARVRHAPFVTDDAAAADYFAPIAQFLKRVP